MIEILIFFGVVMITQMWAAAVINVFTGCKGPEALGVRRTFLYMWLPYAIMGAICNKDRV